MLPDSFLTIHAMRATTARQEDYIRQRHLRNRFLTASSTLNLVVGTNGRPIYRSTMTKRLRDYGYVVAGR